ncbi:nicotinate-nucleotide adenylyltransferase [Catalinimonas niigatensis]|uniref:nicotinate-nucleotide adenylyltransferase n=1 Tax=Catalinimonas niigatensis TaxID=1397264 RepID=UPI002665F45E|nr:nicotinate-nucleotide adenylyltransferase [Catalinimonas niigatensis]WPP49811.1 nicotinate-nucleotide adenylyltransferase [Catalinimonas niigatensis]
MKLSKLLLCLGVLTFGFTLPSFAQVVLPGIEIVATNYKYLNSVGEEAAVPVKQIEEKVASFDVKSADFYQDDYDTYFVSFYIPEGKVLASYDKNGKLLRTIERFKDVDVPMAVREAVAKRFPQWSIAKDAYLVNYHDTKGVTKKTYKLTLENGSERLKVKMNDTGEFI